MTSLSHSAVLLSLPCVKQLPRQRDWKNLFQALEPASPAIAHARPLPPHSAPPLGLPSSPRGQAVVPQRSTPFSQVCRDLISGWIEDAELYLRYGGSVVIQAVA